jgi:tryptophanase
MGEKGIIKVSELEAMLAEVRAENEPYLAARSEEAANAGYAVAMYSMRAIVRRLYKAGVIDIEDDSIHPDNRPRQSS